jgi:hypothetical protein
MKEFVLKGRLTLERVTFYVTGNARGPRRRDLDLLRGRNARERLCRAVVCREQGRDSCGVFHVREDEPAPGVGAGLHRTP